MKPEVALEHFKKHLNSVEMKEILKYDEIHYINQTADGSDDFLKQGSDNWGFDDDKSYYRFKPNDQIAFRFQIIKKLGRGSFGQVVQCYDHLEKEEVALKVIRNKQKFHNPGMIEVDILDHIRIHDKYDKRYLVQMKEAFIFRSHLCITFEMLNMNLYELIKLSNYSGIEVKVIKNMAVQLLIALRFLNKHKIIHCDLKPENILLKHSNKSLIKVIDFGSSCFLDKRLYTYI